MKCNRQKCKCGSNKYSLEFCGLNILFLRGVQCKRCKKVYPIRCVLKHMSLQYLDVMLKGVLLLCVVYYIILGFPFGVIYMFALILLVNVVIYPLLFKLGIMIIDQ